MPLISRSRFLISLLIDHYYVLFSISYPVRDGLLRGIKKALADDKIKAAIIVGKGKTFPSGADIKEFSKKYTGNLI